MDWWTNLGATVERFLEQYGLLAVFALIAVEEAGVPSPIPADVLVLLAALQAREGRVSFWQLLAVAEVATVVGASALYAVAKWAGRDLVYRYGRYLRVGPDRLDRVEATLRRGGVWTVALGRVVPGLRVLTAVACGVFEVPYRLFLPGMALGAFAYILAFALLGYLLGPPVVALLDEVHPPLSALLSLVLLGVVLVWLARARRALEAEPPAGAAERARLRAGLQAGALAAVCSALMFNVLVELIGGLSVLQSAGFSQDTVRRFAVEERRVLPLLVSVFAFVVVGAVWGGVYGRWGEPAVRAVLGADAVRGVAFALAVWGLAVVTLPPVMDVTGAEAVGVAVVEGVQHCTYGVVLGLAYPLFRARLSVSGPGEPRRSPSA